MKFIRALVMLIPLICIIVVGVMLYQKCMDGSCRGNNAGVTYEKEKSFWCDMWAEREGLSPKDNYALTVPYSNIQGEEFCGEIPVKMDCIFSGEGDWCGIERRLE